MAHNIQQHDSMVAVGQTPWHGLGVVLDQPPATGLEALQHAGLDWTVTKRPMKIADSDARVFITSSAVHRRSGEWGTVVRDDLYAQDPNHPHAQLGVVGPSFTPLQNRKMASLFDVMIQDGNLQIETCGSLFNGKRVWMLGKFQNSETTIDTNDTVRNYALLAHGHDGTMAVRFGTTPIRVVCWNTLSAAISAKSRSKLVTVLHTASMESSLEILANTIVEGEKAFELSADQFRLLVQRGVNRIQLREYARLVIDAPEEAKQTVMQRKKIGEIVGAAIEGRGNRGSNWWHAYNGATEYLNYMDGRRTDTRLNKLWFGENVEVSARALRLAIEMSGVETLAV
jgi:phage/plasmid-like protein (TIGR03299 family)